MYRLAPRQSEEPCAVLLVAFFLGEGLDWPANSPQLSLIEGGQFLTDMRYRRHLKYSTHELSFTDSSRQTLPRPE